MNLQTAQSAMSVCLDALAARLDDDYKHFIGFPAALDYDYDELVPLLTRYINNVGDPSVNSWHGVHTKDFEERVVDFFAQLFRAPKGQYWGYVTNGSTECNLYALYAAREKLPQAPVYYSADAHYSIAKNLHILGMRGVRVPSQPSGEMDYKCLETLIGSRQDQQIIIVATVGTTMTEARDDVGRIRQILSACGVEYFIHADAALAGPYAALLAPHSAFDFADGANSVSISGHKFIGCPIPCGVVLTTKEDKERLARGPNYTGSADTTISGSRNGHTPLFLWYAITKWGKTGLRRRAIRSQQLASYTHRRLLSLPWPTWRNPQALTVMLASPPAAIITKWQLATANGWSHIICMPGVTRAKIDAFLADLQIVAQSLR